MRGDAISRGSPLIFGFYGSFLDRQSLQKDLAAAVPCGYSASSLGKPQMFDTDVMLNNDRPILPHTDTGRHSIIPSALFCSNLNGRAFFTINKFQGLIFRKDTHGLSRLTPVSH